MKNVPNILTTIRIILVPLFLVFAFTTFTEYNLYIAFGLFVLGALTDFLDGYIARKYNLVSNIGKFLDPIADKILMLAGLLVLLYIQFMYEVFPFAFTYVTIISIFIILARDYMVDVIRQISSSRGHVIPADIFGKLKTFVQDIAVPMIIFYFALVINSGFAIDGFIFIYGIISYSLFLVGVVLTIFSGINYFVKNREIFKQE